MHIDISIDGNCWDAVDNLESLASNAVGATQDVLVEHVFDNAELSIAFVTDDAIQSLNRDYRGKDSATNVLSFPNDMIVPEGSPRMLGDVILAYETVADEAVRQGKAIDHHISHLVVHGFLHLLGYDHESSAEADQMEALEIRTLERLRIENPYLDVDGTTNDEAVGEADKPI